jgi:hypothetical protein
MRVQRSENHVMGGRRGGVRAAARRACQQLVHAHTQAPAPGPASADVSEDDTEATQDKGDGSVVRAQLARLRRASAASARGPAPTDPLPYALLATGTAASPSPSTLTSAAVRVRAGPAPPPSWQPTALALRRQGAPTHPLGLRPPHYSPRRCVYVVCVCVSVAYLRLRGEPAVAVGVPSLQWLVADRIATLLPRVLAYGWVGRRPASLKELVLERAAWAGTLTDARLPALADGQLMRVDVSLSCVSVAGLAALVPPGRARLPPRVAFAHRAAVADSWEELALALPVRAPPPPCGALVTTLVVDGCAALRGVPFAHWVCAGLPALRHLSMAACFGADDGPDAVALLAHGAPLLRTVDVSACPWVTSAVLRAIGWPRRWPDLERVTARACPALAPDAARAALGVPLVLM